MKRTIMMFFASAAIMLAVVACGPKSSETATEGDTTKVETPAEVPATEPAPADSLPKSDSTATDSTAAH